MYLFKAASLRRTPVALGMFKRQLVSSYAEQKKAGIVESLLNAKQKSGLTFDEIATKVDITNAYAAQLFHRQAHLKDGTAEKLKKAVPALTEQDIVRMKEIPFRTYDRDVIRTEPLIYRLEEGMLHYGVGLKALINEKFGDGIMSSVDMHVTVEKVKGKVGEDRVLLTLNGKFLAHPEQTTD